MTNQFGQLSLPGTVPERLPTLTLVSLAAKEFRRYLLPLAAIFAGIALLFLAWGLLNPATYQSSATVLVQDNTVIPPLMEGRAAAPTDASRAIITRDVLFGHRVMEDVLREGGWLERDLSPVEKELVIRKIMARTEITVTDRTRQVQLRDDGVTRTITTRVVQEFETVDGELEEISRNFFAICQPSRDVYYFGEAVDVYEGDKVVSHEGAWMAGEAGCRHGLMVPAVPLVGARYHQEIAPGIAMDRAEILGTAAVVETPAGTFKDVLHLEETNPEEPGHTEHKYFAPGVGLVKEEENLVLVRYGKK